MHHGGNGKGAEDLISCDALINVARTRSDFMLPVSIDISALTKYYISHNTPTNAARSQSYFVPPGSIDNIVLMTERNERQKESINDVHNQPIEAQKVFNNNISIFKE